VGLLHVLFAVALALGGICARLETALEESRGVRVLVVHVAIALLLGGPPKRFILATGKCTLPGTRMGLLVLGQIARTLEDLVTVLAFLVDIHRRRIFLATGH
jgi:hypothetical protein